MSQPVPSDPNAEQAVLGALMSTTNGAVFDALSRLTAGDFYGSQNRDVFLALVALATEGKPTDPIMVGRYLQEHGKLPEQGGHDVLLDMVLNAAPISSVPHGVEVLVELGQLRQLHTAGLQMAQDARKGQSPAEIRARALEAVEGSARTLARRTTMADAQDQLLSRIESGETFKGAETGFWELDRTLGGLYPGRLYVLGARPSVGKSAFAGNIARWMAEQGRVAFFSLEMSEIELNLRWLTAESRITEFQLREQRLSADEWTRMVAMSERLGALPLDVFDGSSLTIPEIRGQCRKLGRDLRLVVVDYLQLMSAPGYDNRAQEVGSVSRGLKALAVDFEVPVLAVAQLNRNPALERRPPTLTDLRDSGEIEQHANIVLFLHRPIIGPGVDRALCLVAKNRHGSTGAFHLAFEPQFTRFESAMGMGPPTALDAEGEEL